MQSFTMGSPDMVAAMVARLPEHYEMSLNPRDMHAVIIALATAGGFISWDDLEVEPALRERAQSLLSSVGETLGVEGI